MAAMSEFDTGGSSLPQEFDGTRSSDTLRESSRALNWRRVEKTALRARAHASRKAEDAWESIADTVCSEVVWAWPRRRATDTASWSAFAASAVRHCIATATGVGIADVHKSEKNFKKIISKRKRSLALELWNVILCL